MASVYDSVVLVTGVTGYLGSQVAKQLIEDGRKVRGTVRSLANTDKIETLKKALCTNPEHEIELVEADLTVDDGWDKAVEGCSGVIHVASPFPNVSEVEVSEESLIIPAREGTLRVLKAVAKSPSSIKRVVLTSSVASIFAEANYDQEKVHTEEDWTNTESTTIDAYSKSKALAERSAWDFVKELPEEEKFELAVINPGLILGPALLESQKTSTSISIISDLLNKTYPAVPRISMAVCDVRDVARAHIQALSLPEAADHRHIIFTQNMWMKDAANVLAKEFKPQGYAISTFQAPYIGMWLYGCINRQVRRFILPRLGKEAQLDNSRMKDVLKIEPTPLNTMLEDMAYSLIELGIVSKSKKYKQHDSNLETPEDNTTKDDTEQTTEIKTTQELEPEDKIEKNDDKKDVENDTKAVENNTKDEVEEKKEEVKENKTEVAEDDKKDAKDIEKETENEKEENTKE